jgi:LPXTG-motif cell wall-anchored protein
VTSESKAKDKVQNESVADEIILNAAPDEIQKLETIQVSNDKIQNGNEGVADDTIQALPESPDMPELISEPIEKPESRATETALALLGLLLLVVALIVVRRKK